MINTAACDCFFLFVQPSTCALSSEYEEDVFGMSYTRDFASLAGAQPHWCHAATAPSSPGTDTGLTVQGITDFILLINPVLTCGLNIQDKLVLFLCYTDTIFASLLLH